jgi:Tfp pilus assembly protein PilV
MRFYLQHGARDNSRFFASHKRQSGFTLAEVCISLFIATLVFGGILKAYVQAAQRAEWTGHALAAQAYSIQQLEQARSAVWDVSSVTNVNQLTNLNMIGWVFSSGAWRGHSWTNIDIPYSGSNFIRATNFVVVSNVTISTTPPVAVQSVRVDTVWRHKAKNYTNTMVNYYAPDQ